MSGFFLLLALAIAIVILPRLFKPKNGRDHSRIINADWMTSGDKFHLISRWGA